MEDFGRTGPRLLGAHVIVKGLGDSAPEHDVAHQRQGDHLAVGAKSPARNVPHQPHKRFTLQPCVWSGYYGFIVLHKCSSILAEVVLNNSEILRVSSISSR